MAKKPAWIIKVVPPKRLGEPFEIPEWSYDYGCTTVRRYKARGWSAVLIVGNAEEFPWFVRGRGLDELQITARSVDEALMLARLEDPNYDAVQRMW